MNICPKTDDTLKSGGKSLHVGNYLAHATFRIVKLANCIITHTTTHHRPIIEIVKRIYYVHRFSVRYHLFGCVRLAINFPNGWNISQTLSYPFRHLRCDVCHAFYILLNNMRNRWKRKSTHRHCGIKILEVLVRAAPTQNGASRHLLHLLPNGHI